MSSQALIISMAVGFLTTLWIIPKLIYHFKKIGIYGMDQAKKHAPIIPESGGTAVGFGVFAGIMTYMALSTFVSLSTVNMRIILAALITIQTITFIGFMDDILTGRGKTLGLNGDKNFRIGMRQRTKALLVLPAAIPLMVVNAGHSTMYIPFFGLVNFGIIYPLLLVPIGVLAVSNATNMLAGFNGLEAGMGATALFGLGLYTNLIGAREASIVAFIGTACLLAFLYFNWYPSKIFPGDSGTYLTGAIIATVVIIGNIEKFGFIVFFPWVIEAIIKALQGFKATCFGKLTKEGYLKPKNDRIESLTHVVMSLGNFKEYQITTIFVFIEAGFVGLAFLLQNFGII